MSVSRAMQGPITVRPTLLARPSGDGIQEEGLETFHEGGLLATD
jgi:hypothetical protein